LLIDLCSIKVWFRKARCRRLSPLEIASAATISKSSSQTWLGSLSVVRFGLTRGTASARVTLFQLTFSQFNVAPSLHNPNCADLIKAYHNTFD
jgi:hypothetical protein